MSVALDILIFATGYTHVYLAPYSKVEESFNLHATHDVLMYGISPRNLHKVRPCSLQLDFLFKRVKYDHFMFPGAVPRTFIGSVLLAWMVTPILHFARLFGYVFSKSDTQIISTYSYATLPNTQHPTSNTVTSRHYTILS
jgi:alpha-1,6-mannosyltransferase